jgi:hypothetical protein
MVTATITAEQTQGVHGRRDQLDGLPGDGWWASSRVWRDAPLGSGGNISLKFSGHLAELCGDAGEGLPLVLVGREASDKSAVFRICEELFQLGFQVFHRFSFTCRHQFTPRQVERLKNFFQFLREQFDRPCV